MAGMIPRQFIDDLLARADIVELIDSRVPLKKAGKNAKEPQGSRNAYLGASTKWKNIHLCAGRGKDCNMCSGNQPNENVLLDAPSW